MIDNPETRKARYEAGLTVCPSCKDRGRLTVYHGAGGGRFGCRTESVKCGACCRHGNPKNGIKPGTLQFEPPGFFWSDDLILPGELSEG